MAFVDSGPVDATDKFSQTPKSKWPFLILAKRAFLATQLNYDCRCLVAFVSEAEEVWREASFKSAEDMIRNGYELDPVEIELAVAWLRHNEPNSEVSLSDVAAKVAKAKANRLPQNGEAGRGRTAESFGITKATNGTDVDYTLRRLHRDAPEMLDRIESGELSVNQAAIAAGIRKKPTQAEVCVKAFRKASNRVEVLKLIIDELEDEELSMVEQLLKR
jgi:hypothetical protein